MISGDLAKLIGKRIKNVIAYDPFGYDRGFEIETDDGTRLKVVSEIFYSDDTRIRVKEIVSE